MNVKMMNVIDRFMCKVKSRTIFRIELIGTKIQPVSQNFSVDTINEIPTNLISNSITHL